MRSMSVGFKAASIVAFAVQLAGCSVNTNFVYKPNPPVASAQKIPVKVAVLPFADGTANFTQRGSLLHSDCIYYNLARIGVGGTIGALTPELWGKSFADELAASGSIGSARFIYDPSEFKDADILVEGTLKKVTYATGSSTCAKNELLVSFRALGTADGKIVREKEFGQVWDHPGNGGCGMKLQCMADYIHAHWNKAMGAVFAEARADLLKTLAPPEGGTGGASGAGTAKEDASGSVQGTIDRILKEK